MKFIFFLNFCLITVAHASAPVLKVKWVSNCVPLPRHSVISYLTFWQKKVEVKTELYSDHHCKVLNLKIDLIANYNLGKSLKNGRKFDYVPSSVMMTLVSDEVVNYYNENYDQACYLSNWKLGIPKDISGKVCARIGIQEKHIQIYDLIFKSESHLQFGSFPNSGGGLVESDRPQMTNNSVIFRMKET